MADINWVKDRGTFDLSYTSRGTITSGGGETEIKDEDDTTSWWVNAAWSGAPPPPNVVTTCEVTFDQSTSLSRVRSVIMSSENGSGSPHSRILSYYDGAWHDLVNGSVTRNTVITDDYTGLSLTNVTKVRIQVSSIGYTIAKADTYELSAWGPAPGQDSGIRIYTSTGVKIVAAADTLGTESLRVYAGAGVKGIKLVDPAADGAIDGLRIYTSDGVKCLEEYT